MPLSEAPSRAQRKVKSNTIVYSTVRPRLKHYGILNSPPYNLIVSSGFVTIDLKKEYEDRIDARYLFLLLTQPAITEYIACIADSAVSAYPSFNPSDISEIAFSFPNIEKQKAISEIWSNFEQKISINRQINDNLEAMAKQLYDYWFVQFDFPNEEGKPYKSSGGAMVWNEKLKREIPKGWNFCFLENLLIIRNGRDHKHLADGIYPVYGSGGEMRKASEYLYDGESVLMPRKGSLNNIMYVNEAFWTVDTMFYSEIKQSNCAKYIYYTIKDIDFTRWDSGTGVPSMTSSTLYSIKLVKPQSEILKKFDEVISPLFEHMKQISEQNSVLTKQRDELLPLLMNGQASVNSD
jgi:restriction endonuclease S subunit